MRPPLVPLAVAGALIATFASDAPAQNAYQQVVRRQLEQAASAAIQQGYRADREPMTGALNDNAVESMRVALEGGVRYVIVGVCDQDCTDVDLRIWAPDGVKIDEDILVDDTPVLEFTAPTTGQYRVTVEMATCNSNPCYWGVQVFARR